MAMKTRASATPAWVSEELQRLQRDDLHRERTPARRIAPGRIEIGDRVFVDFASNDYLGLAADPRLAQAAREYLDAETGWGSGASPLITGFHPIHLRLETELARFMQTEAAIVFGSGFTLNAAILPALAGPNDLIFSERRNHASLIDGCRLARASVEIYRKEELDSLVERLRETRGYRRRFIVTDTVFSMDGDVAPLRDLVEIAEREDAILYIDESHAIGVLGPTGAGLAEREGLIDRIPLRMGTLSKSLGGAGGFLAASHEWVELIVNRCRSYIFSTAAPAILSAVSLIALSLLREEAWRREKVLRLAESLRTRLDAAGWPRSESVTPIVPVIMGGPTATLRLASALREKGFVVGAVRPPTVPKGACRLRISVSAAHEEAEIQALVEALHARRDTTN